jgi:hypothetical protein
MYQSYSLILTSLPSRVLHMRMLETPVLTNVEVVIEELAREHVDHPCRFRPRTVHMSQGSLGSECLKGWAS